MPTINNFRKKVKKKIALIFNKLTQKNKTKIFCIGHNKTGTTSMKKLSQQLGIWVAPQRPAEKLLKDYANNDYKSLIEFVKKHGNFFQDVPFSLPNTYKILEKEFPDAKFILTVRDSPDAWYNSVLKYGTKFFNTSTIPTKDDLMNSDYVHKGWLWEKHQLLHNVPEDDIFNEEILKSYYLEHNQSVLEYFKDKPGKLLVVNLKEENVVQKICNFLEIKTELKKMPWINKS